MQEKRYIILNIMELDKHIQSHFEAGIENLKASATVLTPLLSKASHLLAYCIENGGKILACGNGGSASDAQHFVAELVGRFERERMPLPAVALNTDTSILTAIGNDYGYEYTFSRQVAALGITGDVLIAISTSGNSANVIHAIEEAHANGMVVVALTGKGGGKIAKLLTEQDIHLCVPHDRTMRIQEVHIMLLHILCDGIDTLLLGVN